MKTKLIFYSLALSLNAFAGTTVFFEGQNAKTAYKKLVGPKVTEEGEGSRNHRVGVDLDCSHSGADIEDGSGTPISIEDPMRYECRYVVKSLKYDSNGEIK